MPRKKVNKITKKYLKKLEKREINKKDKEWSFQIKKRDENRCILSDFNCKQVGIIHTHHIVPRENKKYRWNVNNGVCLCPKHHKYSLDISAHKNSFVFIMWLLKNRKEQVNNIIK